MKQFKQFFLILCLTIVGGVSNAWAQTENTVTINNLVYELIQSTVDGKYAYIIDFSNFDKETLIIPATITIPDAWNGSDVVYKVWGFNIKKDITNDYIRKMIFKGKNSFYNTYHKVVNCPNLQKIFFMTGNWGVAFDYPVGENQPLDLYFKEVPSMNSDVLPPHPELCTAHVAMNDDDFAVLEQQIADGSIWGWPEFKNVVQWDGVSEINDPEAPEYVKMNLTLKGPSLSMDTYGGVEDINVLHDNYAKEDPLTVTSVLCRKGYQFRFKCSTIIKDSYCLKRVVVNGYDILSEIEGRCTEIPYIVNYGSDDEVNIVVETECFAPAVEIISTDGGTLSWTDRNGNAKSLTEDGKSTLRIDKDSPIIVTITPDEGSILQGVSSIFSEGSYFNSNDYSSELYDDFIAVLVQMGQTEEAAHEQMLNGWGLKKLADGSWQMAVSTNSSDGVVKRL